MLVALQIYSKTDKYWKILNKYETVLFIELIIDETFERNSRRGTDEPLHASIFRKR